MGYSDGDELIFGHFSNGTFIKNIQIIPNGDYKSPSTAPEIVLPPTEPRGAVWESGQEHQSLNSQHLFSILVI